MSSDNQRDPLDEVSREHTDTRHSDDAPLGKLHDMRPGPNDNMDTDALSHDGLDPEGYTTSTNSEDEFDWEADDDGASTGARTQGIATTTKAKRGQFLWLTFMRLSRLLRTIIVGVLGVAILITPFLVVHLRFKHSPVRPHVHAWSLWFAVMWAASCITFLVVDLVPRLFISIIVLLGYKVEFMKVQIEVSYN